MRFDILTIFPQIFDSYIAESILKRARNKKLVEIHFHNFREFTYDQHKTVDDTPYGGGPGMILKVEPIYQCLEKLVGLKDLKVRIKKRTAGQSRIRIIIMSPRGQPFNQTKAEQLAAFNQLVLICGRYEGIDARVEKLADDQISIGQYVLSGGELPAMVVVEAVTRLLPGVLGSPDSLTVESYNFKEQSHHINQINENKNLNRHFVEYPQYTRPPTFEPIPGVQWSVPKVLLSGDHKKIAEWRAKKMSANLTCGLNAGKI